MLGLERFAELVDKRSRGRLKVLVFPGGTLGSDEVSIAALQAGTLEMASLNSGILANQVGAFAVFDLPLLFSGDGEADAILDSPFGRSMHASLQAKGLVGLAYYELGFRQITNGRRPIGTVADIEGLSLRVIPTRLNIDWVRALRAQAVPIPFPDVLRGPREQGRRWPGQPPHRHRGQPLRPRPEIPAAQPAPIQPAVGAHQQEGLGRARCHAPVGAVGGGPRVGHLPARRGAALESLRKRGMVVTRLPDGEARKMAERLRPVTDKYLKALPADVLAGLRRARGAAGP